MKGPHPHPSPPRTNTKSNSKASGSKLKHCPRFYIRSTIESNRTWKRVQNNSPLQLYPLHPPPHPHQDNILHLKSLHHRSGLYQQTEGAAGQTDKVRQGQRRRRTSSQLSSAHLQPVQRQTPARKLQPDRRTPTLTRSQSSGVFLLGGGGGEGGASPDWSDQPVSVWNESFLVPVGRETGQQTSNRQSGGGGRKRKRERG